jgi:RimJ/RimL family protein N-acetyltransferase
MNILNSIPGWRERISSAGAKREKPPLADKSVTKTNRTLTPQVPIMGLHNPEEKMHQLARTAVPDDATQLFSVIKRTQAESPYLLLQKDEGVASVQAQATALEKMHQDDHRCVFVALDGARIVGYAGLNRGAFARCTHLASLMMAVCNGERRRGHGRRLLAAVEIWARDHGVKRLELSVVATNISAKALYQAAGFVVEGVRKQSFLLNGELVDELYMAKLL